MTEIAELVAARGIVKAKLTRIINYVKGFESSTNLQHLKARKELLPGILKEFEEVQYKIELIEKTATAARSQVEEREAFENQYFEVSANIEIIIENVNHPAGATADVSVNSNPAQLNIKLPPVNLPSFTGKYSEWFSFHDLFNSLVHENENLNDCQKMHYLKSSLKGEALRSIESLTISNANYASAWEIINKRYENKRLTVQEHVLAIINAMNINKSTHVTIRQFINTIKVNVEALKVLKLPTKEWDALIVPLLTEKLDYISKREWYATLDEKIPTLGQFLEFLEKRCQFLESLEASNKSDNFKPYNYNKINSIRGQQSNYVPRTSSYVATNKPHCFMCKGFNHFIYQCSKFLKLSINDRIKQIDSLKLCKNCFRDNHASAECKSTYKCRDCNAKHNSLLHVESQIQELGETTVNEGASTVNCCVAQTSEVFLSTALVLVKDSRNEFQTCRALLDVGAQSNFITKEATSRLGLTCKNTNIAVSGLGQAASKVTSMTTATIKSRTNQFELKVSLLIVPTITDPLPNFSVEIKRVHIPNNIVLADPNFCVRGPIDILLGAGVFWQLMCAGQIHLAGSQPYFQKTHFGWVVGGSMTDHNVNSNKTIANLSTSDDRLERQVAKFFEIEDYSDKKILSPEERACEEHFKNFHKRADDGRFIVKLPFKDNIVELGESRKIAIKRFYALENKLERNPSMKLEYADFMQEYIDLGHMELVPENQIDNINNYYIPHHAVYKMSSTTTRLRVVFDASCQTSNGVSINDNLMIGPAIQQDLFSILIRFRILQYVINADINKMYRQIRIDKSQTDYQRIIWREDSNQNLKTYRLLTVTYGFKPSSFLAVRCLHELANQAKSKHPLASKAIVEDFYMDDLLTGANSIQEAIKLQKQIDNILLGGGFQLRKWNSNSQTIISSASKNSEDASVSLQGDTAGKILGLHWDTQRDSLKYSFKLQTDHKKVTKRIILGIASQLFDPLGLVSAVTIKAKILIQQLWSLKISWDESVPLSIYTAWKQFMTELSHLQELTFSRKVIPQFPIISLELHGFCDSSEQAYGAVVYIRTVDYHKNCFVNLFCAKARVAPLKTTTLARLELSGALLLAQLSNKLKKYANVDFNAQYFWTDSTIVLSWLASPSKVWKTFVANRVSEIQSLTEIKNWHHIKSKDNPADILSRGAYPKQLINNTLWHNGPQWLSLNKEQWPPSNFTKREESLERRPIILVAQTTTENSLLDSLMKHSSYSKIERVTAYCLRFVHNCKNKENKETSSLSVKELKEANIKIILIIQNLIYSVDIHNLQKNGHIDKSSMLKPLDPFLDDQKLLRVGGRLKNASLQYDKKFPVILPPKHYITKLIVKAEHEKQLHAGPLATLASLRRKYWVISGRNLIRNITRSCVRCYRVNPKPIQQKMGNLPKERLEPIRPFLKSGVDFAGPVIIKNVTGRSKSKAYIALFVCFATKAVHLELVGDLTTPSFINAFNRFISRRGQVLDIFCDNAKNFIGADREFKRLFKCTESRNELSNQLKRKQVEFHFIPPRAPHMGGLWESSIKSVKLHLKRILGDACVTYEELYTLLTRIEAILNSRPITPISNDPNDLQALTPGHFLIGEALTAPLTEDVSEIKIHRLSRWQRIEQLRQHFWKRWSREYLGQLQERTKWQAKTTEVKIGSMVILKEDSVPPLQWKLGRITSIHPGSDGVVRVVSVKVGSGTMKRALNKICFLPVE